MSVAAIDTAAAEARPGPLPEGRTLWIRQLMAMVAIELRRNLLGRRSLLVYALAGLPVFVMLMMVIVRRPGGEPVFENLGQARTAYAMVFQTFILRAVIFFGCVGIFTNLFRGEVLDRSLHYYLLSPLRREVLAAGKFLAGLVQTWVLFVGTVVVSFCLLYPPFGVSRSMEDFFQGPGLSQLLAYIGVTLLACLGYGALFVIVGLVFKNPIVPAAVVLMWEGLVVFLPPLLKKLSVINYLRGLYPLPMSEGPFAVISPPPPAWVSVFGLLGFAIAVLFVAGFYVKRMEIRYGED